MKPFSEHFFQTERSVQRMPWTLVPDDGIPVLPVRLPFTECADRGLNLIPAIELYALRQLDAARRFVELTLSSTPLWCMEQWRLRLVIAGLHLQAGNAANAARVIRAAFTWRTHIKGLDTRNFLEPIAPAEWLFLAVTEIGNGDLTTTETYTSECLSQLQKHSACCAGDLLCDTRGDAMTVFAAIRMAQDKHQEAEMLLNLSYDAYMQAGDMEQLVVTLMYLADLGLVRGEFPAADDCLAHAHSLVESECDETRHHRGRIFGAGIQQRVAQLRPERPQRMIQALN